MQSAGIDFTKFNLLMHKHLREHEEQLNTHKGNNDIHKICLATCRLTINDCLSSTMTVPNISN